MKVASPIAQKVAFYQRDDIAEGYEGQRYGSPSGKRVLERELAIALNMLSPDRLVADIGCGPGRLSAALWECGHSVISCDTSSAMLVLARRRGARLVVQGDAFNLPLSRGAFASAMSLRLLFHFHNVAPLLSEFRRIVRNGGALVCDTYSWSPRSLIAVGRQRWGKRVATLSRSRFRELAQQSGWSVRDERPCFLVSPYIYRCLPLPASRLLERLERHVPSVLLCRTFWRLEAT